MNKITIYTDGAVSGNGKGNAKGGWAAIILQEGAPPIEICGAENDTTNQRMELMAVLKAFEKIAANEYDEIEILSDSAYFCNCYNQNWYEKWLINGFQTASKQPVKNVDLWLYKRIQQLGETTVSMPDDYLALDKEGSTETNKIRKRDFLQGYLQEPDLEQAYPTKAWARRGGTWIEIFPDEYVLEANIDGRIYARSDGDWVVIGEDGLSGDMYAVRYDQRNHGTDIFDIVQKQLNKSS